MIKIDLITGFLGSGKTTFIKKYAKYLIDSGENICILENDFGAINVDMMLLSELIGDKCELEMVSGGCDVDCHKRRFKTKLISMGMCGYTRVIVEPSGIFDTDEFFDALKEDPLDRWYEIGSVITIVDSKILDDELDINSKYLLASESANAGVVIISKQTDSSFNKLEIINNSFKEIKCQRILTDSDIISKPWNELSDIDFEKIKNAGYTNNTYEKIQSIEENGFDSTFLMNKNLTKDILVSFSKELFDSNTYGNILRIKGFFKENDSWFEFNSTKNELSINPIPEGQDVVIIIGNKLNKDLINKKFEAGQFFSH